MQHACYMHNFRVGLATNIDIITRYHCQQDDKVEGALRATKGSGVILMILKVGL